MALNCSCLELPLCHSFGSGRSFSPLPLPPPACSLPGTSPFFSAHPMVTAGSRIMRLFGAGWGQRENLGLFLSQDHSPQAGCWHSNHTGPRAHPHQLLKLWGLLSCCSQLTQGASTVLAGTSCWLPSWWLLGLF